MPEINYFWDEIEDNVVREYDENNNTIASYTTEPTLYGPVLSQERSGEENYFHYDGQGNTAELTDESGLVTDTFRYSAFGDETQAVGATQCTYKYQGRCGFYTTPYSSDVRHRKYRSDYGRWTSLDPLFELLNDGRSPYCYALNCPTRVSDKSGLLSQVEMDSNPPFGGTVYPKLGDCGRFFHTFRWELSPTERLFGGFIIQFVTDTFKPETCKGTKPYPDCPLQEVWDNLPAPVNQKRCDNYWELWEVPEPSNSIDPSDLHDANPKFYDTFAFPGYRAPSR